VYATTAEECRAACCNDDNCEVFQFAEPVDSCCGVGCWRGVASTCDGPDVPDDDIAGRRTFVDFKNPMLHGNTSMTEAPETPNIRQMLMPLGDVIALLSSSAVLSLLLCLAAIFCYRRHVIRANSRRVVPRIATEPPPSSASSGSGASTPKPKLPAQRVKRKQVAPAPPSPGFDAPHMRRAGDLATPPRVPSANAVPSHLRLERLRDAHERRAAMTLQREYRAHLVRRYLREYRRHHAAVRLQVGVREFLDRRHKAAAKMQRGLSHFAAQRAEARRLMGELTDMLETTREEAEPPPPPPKPMALADVLLGEDDTGGVWAYTRKSKPSPKAQERARRSLDRSERLPGSRLGAPSRSADPTESH
jgi:hypothetical protein